MQFGIQNPSFLFPNGKTRIFDDLKRKAQWAEAHGFVWFVVMDHMIQIATGVGMVSVGGLSPLHRLQYLAGGRGGFGVNEGISYAFPQINRVRVRISTRCSDVILMPGARLVSHAFTFPGWRPTVQDGGARVLAGIGEIRPSYMIATE